MLFRQKSPYFFRLGPPSWAPLDFSRSARTYMYYMATSFFNGWGRKRGRRTRRVLTREEEALAASFQTGQKRRKEGKKEEEEEESEDVSDVASLPPCDQMTLAASLSLSLLV